MAFLKKLLSQKTTQVALANLIAAVIYAAGVQIDQQNTAILIAGFIASAGTLYGIAPDKEKGVK